MVCMWQCKVALNVPKAVQQDVIVDGCQRMESGKLVEVVAIKSVCVLWKTVQIDVQ